MIGNAGLALEGAKNKKKKKERKRKKEAENVKKTTKNEAHPPVASLFRGTPKEEECVQILGNDGVLVSD